MRHTVPRVALCGLALTLLGLGSVPARADHDTPGDTVAQPVAAPSGYVSGDPAIGADGTAFYSVATAPDSNPRDAVYLLRRPGAGWSAPQRVAPPGTDVGGGIVGDVAGDGRLWLLWSRPDRDDDDRGLWVQSVRPDGTASTPLQLSSSPTYWYDLSVSDDGDVAAVWREFESSDVSGWGTRAMVRPAGGAWGAATRLGDASDSAHPIVEALPDGDVVALWSEDQAEPVPGVDVYRGRVYDSVAGTWGPAMTLGTGTADSEWRSELAVSATGDAVFSWREAGRYLDRDTGLAATVETELATDSQTFVVTGDGSVVRYRSGGPDQTEDVTRRVRAPSGTWSEPATLLETSSSSVPDAVADGEGRVLLTVWMSGFFPGGEYGTGRRVLRDDGGEVTDLGMVKGFGEVYDNPVAVTPTGDGLVVGTQPAFPVQSSSQAYATAVDLRGPVVTLTGPGTWTLADTARVRWEARDLWSLEGSTYTLTRRHAAAVGGDWVDAGTVATTPDLVAESALAPGTTACFQVAGSDGVGNAGAPGGERCTTAPADDRAFDRSKGWRTLSAPGRYAGTALSTKLDGAWLRLPVVARRIAVVADRCRTCGRVEVRFGRDLLGRISLRGPARKSMVIPVATFRRLREGRLEVRAVGSRSVVVDGVGVSRR